MSNYLGFPTRLQYCLVSLNEEALFLDNLTLGLGLVIEFTKFFHLFYTVILYFQPMF